jgi:hypothetical protein
MTIWASDRFGCGCSAFRSVGSSLPRARSAPNCPVAVGVFAPSASDSKPAGPGVPSKVMTDYDRLLAITTMGTRCPRRIARAYSLTASRTAAPKQDSGRLLLPPAVSGPARLPAIFRSHATRECDYSSARLRAHRVPRTSTGTEPRSSRGQGDHEPSRKPLRRSATNRMSSNVTVHPSPVGDCASKPTLTLAGDSLTRK